MAGAECDCEPEAESLNPHPQQVPSTAMEVSVPTHAGPGSAKSVRLKTHTFWLRHSFSMNVNAPAAKQSVSSVNPVSQLPEGAPTEAKSIAQMYPLSGHCNPRKMSSPFEDANPQNKHASSDAEAEKEGDKVTDDEWEDESVGDPVCDNDNVSPTSLSERDTLCESEFPRVNDWDWDSDNLSDMDMEGD